MHNFCSLGRLLRQALLQRICQYYQRKQLAQESVLRRKEEQGSSQSMIRVQAIQISYCMFVLSKEKGFRCCALFDYLWEEVLDLQLYYSHMVRGALLEVSELPFFLWALSWVRGRHHMKLSYYAEDHFLNVRIVVSKRLIQKGCSIWAPSTTRFAFIRPKLSH